MKFVDLIRGDLRYTKLALEGTDEVDVNIASYHAQQAVEKLCAYACQKKGVKTIRTHEMDKWIEHLDEAGIAIPEKIRELAEDITEWESQARYNINFMVSKARVYAVYDACTQWLDLLDKPIKCSFKIEKEDSL